MLGMTHLLKKERKRKKEKVNSMLHCDQLAVSYDNFLDSGVMILLPERRPFNMFKALLLRRNQDPQSNSM
jgi:hypothetical protein